MLKPHVDSKDGVWRGDFEPEDVEAWFESYRNFMGYCAWIANETGAELFCIGCEYAWSDGAEYDQWLRTIAKVRKECEYEIEITYAAAPSSYGEVCFWEDVDYIGINPYFSLSSRDAAGLAALVKGWDKALGDIETWREAANLTDKSIIFTEIGYESQPGCWKNPARTGREEVDTRAQELCYKALFMRPPARPWLKGIYLWWWDNPSTYDAGGGPDNNGFTPKRKPAEKVLSDYYHRYR